MKRFLYHGSDKKIKFLEPKKPSDTKKQNSIKAVYATDNKRLALGMSLTNHKGSISFLTKNLLKINFVRGEPKEGFVYLHYLNPKNFKRNAPGQYLSLERVKPLKIQKYKVSSLKPLWRKSNKQELNLFLKSR